MVVRELLVRLGLKVGPEWKQVDGKIDRIKVKSEQAADAFRNMFAAFAGVAAIKSLSSIADQMQSMQARVGMLPQTVSDASDAFDIVGKRATDARQSIDAYGNLYIKLANAGKDYIKTQDEALQVTDTLSKALVVGGATAQEQSSAMLQFAQAIGSGVLQGDELRAMAEASPQFMDELAKAMGKPRSELKKLGSEGKLTSKDVIQAVQKMSDVFDKKFREMPMTIGQATTIMGNRWAMFVNRLNRESGAVTKIADIFLTGFDKIESGLNSMVEFFGGATNTLKFFAIAITALVLPALVKLGIGLVASILSPAGAIVAGLLLLGVFLEDVYTWIKGGDSVMGSWLGTWDEFLETLKEHENYYKAWASVIGGILVGIGIKFAVMAGTAVASMASIVASTLAGVASMAAGWIASFGSMAIATIAATWPILLYIAAIAAVAAAAYLLLENWDEIMGFIKQIATDAWNWITDGFNSMIGKLKDGWNSFKSFFGMGAETTINATTSGGIASVAPATAAGIRNAPVTNNTGVSQNNTFQFQMPAGSTQQQVDALRGAVQQNDTLGALTRQMATVGGL